MKFFTKITRMPRPLVGEFHFDIRYSVFDLPAMPLILFEIVPIVLLVDTVTLERPRICMAGGYSAVLFCGSRVSNYFSDFEMTSKFCVHNVKNPDFWSGFFIPMEGNLKKGLLK